VDNGADTLQKKVRNGEIAQYNFILGMISLAASTFVDPFAVVGEEEMNTQSVNVRNRDDVGSKVRAEMMPLDDIATKLLALKSSRSLHNKL
jgi:threonyl-tRNA synthetase